MKKAARIRQIFTELANEVAVALADGRSLDPEPGPVTSPLVIREGLVLAGDLAASYFGKVAEAGRLVEENPAWTADSIDTLFAAHLGSVIAASDRKVAVSVEAGRLGTELAKEPPTFERSVCVFGLAPDLSRTQFGLVALELDEVTPRFGFGTFLRANEKYIGHFARLQVAAISVEAAKRRAVQIVDKHLAILNALWSEDYPSKIVLSSRYVGSKDIYIQQGRDDSGDWLPEIGSSVVRRVASRELVGKLHSARGGERLSEMVRSNTSFANRIVGGFETAGSACIESTPHTAFLLFAIALESSLLGQGTTQELTYQLAVRAAHLLSSTSKGREVIFQSVKDLYATRSRIVHAGAKDVSTSDVEQIRVFCLGCLHVLVNGSDFREMTTSQELDEYFLRRALN